MDKTDYESHQMTGAMRAKATGACLRKLNPLLRDHGVALVIVNQIRNKVEPSAVLLLAAQGEGKVVLVAGISRGLVEQGANAGNWVREVAPVVGGGGGGKPDMAQAGGKDASKIPRALEKATEIITQMLG